MKRRIALAIASVAALVLGSACFPRGEDRDASDELRANIPGGWELPRNSEGKVTECGRPVARSAKRVCTVTSSGTADRVFRGTVLLPDETLHTGEVMISETGTIVCASCDCSSSPGYGAASVIECADGVISPGLINPHDHITYANNAPASHGTERYEHRQDWRRGLRGHTPLQTTSGASADVVRFAELRSVMAGVTSIAASGGEVGLARNVDDQDPRLLEGLPILPAKTDTFPLDDTSGFLVSSGCNYGANRTTTANVSGLESYLPHLAEGIGVEAHNEFSCSSIDAPTQKKYDLLQKRTAIRHGIALTAADARELQREQSSVVWSPRSNISLYGNTASVTMLDAAGVQISLGTDWIPAGSMNLLRELHCADELNKNHFGKHFSDSDLWRMVTVNGAFAVGAPGLIGAIKPGYVADIAIFDAKTRKDHRAVIEAGVEDVALVLRGGKTLYGDTDLLDHPVMNGAACEPIGAGRGDVCGAPKKACVAQDTGGTASLARIREAGEAVYPLFFCRDQKPANEPTCAPYRPEYKDGITPTDQDGDGVSDDKDNCPNVFNPVRPLDHGKQADEDADGAGDACDRCPNDGQNSCRSPDANDLDGDGISNGKDNCAEESNADQRDSDADGHGDVCDKCPAANPGASPCAVTVVELRDPKAAGHPKEHGAVVIRDAWVTAVTSPSGSGGGLLYLQTGTAAHNGILVLAGSTARNVAVGNRVSVEGVYSEALGVSQVTAASVDVTDASVLPKFEPIDVTLDEIRTGGAKVEAYESMLVRVRGQVSITDDMPDGPANYFYEFVVDGKLRVDDAIYARYGTPSPSDAYPSPPAAGFTNGTVFRSLTGILSFSFGNSKLQPRGAADLPRP